MKKSPKYPIKVLDKSLSVLELLLQQDSAMNMTELSEKLGFYPSTIHRILDTLKHWDYVEQDHHTQKLPIRSEGIRIRYGQTPPNGPGKRGHPLFKRVSKPV